MKLEPRNEKKHKIEIVILYSKKKKICIYQLLYFSLFFYRHLKLFQDQLKHQSENFYKDDMKIEAHIVRKESAIIGLNYSKGSQIIFFCLKCKRSYAFKFYHLPYNMFGISGHPLTIATSSEFPFLHFCKNINRARLRG